MTVVFVLCPASGPLVCDANAINCCDLPGVDVPLFFLRRVHERRPACSPRSLHALPESRLVTPAANNVAQTKLFCYACMARIERRERVQATELCRNAQAASWRSEPPSVSSLSITQADGD